jgi:hypothetical protein
MWTAKAAKSGTISCQARSSQLPHLKCPNTSTGREFCEYFGKKAMKMCWTERGKPRRQEWKYKISESENCSHPESWRYLTGADAKAEEVQNQPNIAISLSQYFTQPCIIVDHSVINHLLRQGVYHSTVELRSVMAIKRDIFLKIVGKQLEHVSVAIGVEQWRVQELGFLEACCSPVTLCIDNKLKMKRWKNRQR